MTEIENIIRLVVENNVKIVYLLQQKRKYLRLAILSYQKCKRLRTLAFGKRIKKKYRRFWTSAKNSQFWEVDVPAFTDEIFKNTFRVNKTTFHYLANSLKKIRKTNTHLRNAIPLEKRIGVALYSLASSVGYKTVASLFGIGRTTAGEIVVEVCEEICRVLHEVTFEAYPPLEANIDEIVSRFQRLSFPHLKQLNIILKASCILQHICNNQNDLIHQNWLIDNVEEKNRIRRLIVDHLCFGGVRSVASVALKSEREDDNERKVGGRDIGDNRLNCD